MVIVSKHKYMFSSERGKAVSFSTQKFIIQVETPNEYLMIPQCTEIAFERIVVQTDMELGFTAFEVGSCPTVDVEQHVLGHKIQTIPGFVFNY